MIHHQSTKGTKKCDSGGMNWTFRPIPLGVFVVRVF